MSPCASASIMPDHFGIEHGFEGDGIFDKNDGRHFECVAHIIGYDHLRHVEAWLSRRSQFAQEDLALAHLSCHHPDGPIESGSTGCSRSIETRKRHFTRAQHCGPEILATST